MEKLHFTVTAKDLKAQLKSLENAHDHDWRLATGGLEKIDKPIQIDVARMLQGHKIFP